ncbi:DNA methylase [Pseudobutyrivibrio sp. UC1225]|uniref:TRM11 family SAM-dependent methyltransferase n=1 Tax=Pseudobutyrivibrio sp. UC1225 TaxID=1798185 RepID=UPI0008EDE4A8|nr:DNA methyltransferase [Pseudobutyrivibrio sp. UC1225]SFO16139.1 DNA methylase [Pseudobutyrivibrio sp. UC1225]
MKKEITKWEPEDFCLEYNTVWSFPDRGNWATHDSKWRGNWSPYIPRNIILRYSKENDWVLDQFAGGGTTLVEAKLLNRNVIGVDVNDLALERCVRKLDFNYSGGQGIVKLKKGDARKLDFLKDNSIDLICTHPPYANIIDYSNGKNVEGDLSSYDAQNFLHEIEKVAKESYRVLKKGGFCCVLMGDIRCNGKVFPLGFEVMKRFEAAGFSMKEIVIKEQHNCRSTDYWKEISVKNNFLLLAHEYLFILKK